MTAIVLLTTHTENMIIIVTDKKDKKRVFIHNTFAKFSIQLFEVSMYFIFTISFLYLLLWALGLLYILHGSLIGSNYPILV